MSISFFSNRLSPASVVPPGEVTASLKFLGEFSVILMSSPLPMNVSIASFLLTSLDKPIFSPAKIKDSKILYKNPGPLPDNAVDKLKLIFQFTSNSFL